jgi:hypothetical protein
MPLECLALKERLEPPDETAPKETLAKLAGTEGLDLEDLPEMVD